MMDRYNDKCLKTINFFNYEQKCFGTLPVIGFRGKLLQLSRAHSNRRMFKCLVLWDSGILFIISTQFTCRTFLRKWYRV